MFSFHRFVMFTLPCLLVASTGGCASIISGGQEPVRFTSNPSGAHVEIVDHKGHAVHSDDTPFTVTLKRGKGYFGAARYTVRSTSADGQSRQDTLKAGLNGWYFGNILFGGLVGMVIVDPLTGAMWNLPDHAQIDFSLPPDQQLDKPSRAAKGRVERDQRATSDPPPQGAAGLRSAAASQPPTPM